MIRLKHLATTAALIIASTFAAHATTFYFNFHSTSGTSLYGHGSFAGTAEAGNPNAFDLASASGTVNGSAINLVASPGANSTNYITDPSGLFFIDNVLFTSGHSVDYDGLLLNAANGTQYNLFYDNGYVAIPTTSYPNETPIAFAVSATPEPSSIALLGTGLLGMAGMVRRKFVTVS